MIIERPLGNLKDDKFKDLEVDYVDFEWYELRRRIQKVTSRGGYDIGLRWDQETLSAGLMQDDVLAVEDGKAIAINVKETEAIVAKINTVREAAKLCYEIGNRHAPLFFGENFDEIIMPYDKPMLVMLEKLHAHPEVKQRKLLNSHALSSVSTGTDTDGHSHTHGGEEGKMHTHFH